MEQDYRIETLVSTFLTHACHAEEIRKKMAEKYKEDFPDSELPPHFKDDVFNLSTALSAMCAEIVILKEKIGNK